MPIVSQMELFHEQYLIKLKQIERTIKNNKILFLFKFHIFYYSFGTMTSLFSILFE